MGHHVYLKRPRRRRVVARSLAEEKPGPSRGRRSAKRPLSNGKFTTDNILNLQQTVGNKFVMRLLTDNDFSEEDIYEEEPAAAQDAASETGETQPAEAPEGETQPAAQPPSARITDEDLAGSHQITGMVPQVDWRDF